MLITKNGLQYKVKWQYDKEGLFTSCIISTMNNSDHYIGTARKSVHDKFDKEKARKISFGRALKELFPMQESSRMNLVKNARNNCWQVYRNLTLKPKW